MQFGRGVLFVEPTFASCRALVHFFSAAPYPLAALAIHCALTQAKDGSGALPVAVVAAVAAVALVAIAPTTHL